MILQAEVFPAYDILKDLSGLSAFIILAIWMLRESKKRQEDLQSSNSALLQQLQSDHKESRDKLMDLHQKTIDKHEECNERYAELLGSCNTAIANNTQAMQRLADKIKV